MMLVKDFQGSFNRERGRGVGGTGSSLMTLASQLQTSACTVMREETVAPSSEPAQPPHGANSSAGLLFVPQHATKELEERKRSGALQESEVEAPERNQDLVPAQLRAALTPPPSTRSHHSRTYKVLSDVVEVFSVFLQRLFEHGGLGGAPLLHLIPAEHGAPCWDQHAQSTGQVVVKTMESVHSVELEGKGSNTSISCCV